MTKNEKAAAKREAAKAALAVFARTVANWSDKKLAEQVPCYAVSSPRNAARKIVEAEASKRGMK